MRRVPRPRGVLVMAAFSTACSLEDLDARSRFIEETVGKQAPEDWKGETVVVDVAPAGIGGIEIRATPETTRVIATATFVAVADTFDKASADRSIEAAKGTFSVVTEAGTTRVSCPHGTDSGSSKGVDSGCERVVVSVPVGDAARPLRLTVRAQRGALIVSTGGAFVAQAELVAVAGDIDAALPASQGSTASVTSESAGTVTVRLPSAFAADKITLDAPQGSIDSAALPGVTSGQGRGAAGAGFASLTVASKPIDRRGGRVLLVPF